MKLVWYVFHNSKGKIFVWVYSLKNDFSSERNDIKSNISVLPVYNKRLIPCIMKVTPSCSIFLPEFRRRSRVHQNVFANVFGIHYSISPIKTCWNNKNLRTLTVLFRSLWSSDLSRMNNNKNKLKRIHEASKKCTNITKMERHRYILIEISALFFSKTSMLCIFSAFFRRFISV